MKVMTKVTQKTSVMGYTSSKDRVKDVKGILAKNKIYKVRSFISKCTNIADEFRLCQKNTTYNIVHICF